MRAPLPSEDLDFILQETRAVWQALRGSRIWLTGATGFLGSWLIESIQRANDSLGTHIEILALSRSPAHALAHAPHLARRKDISWLQGDVCQLDHLQPGPIDVVIHAATDVGNGGRETDHLHMFDVCVQGTQQTLSSAIRCGATRFLLLSSGAVYGPQPHDLERTPESHAGAPDCLKPSSAYGEGKRAAEWLTSTYAAQTPLQCAIARIFALLGPGLPLDGPFAAGNFIRDVMLGRTIHIQGDGQTTRSYLYAADTCIWLWHVLMGATNKPVALNVGSEHAVTIQELAARTALLGTPPLGVNVSGQPGAPASRYVPDTTMARTSLQLREYTPLPLAIEKTLAWNLKSIRS